MKLKHCKLTALCSVAALGVMAFSQAPQQSDLIVKLTGGTSRVIALPDFRAGGGAAAFADLFNRTVFEDIERSGLLAMAPKSFYPLSPPQQESDLRPSSNCGGRCLSDWSAAPVNANYLAFGYAADQSGQFVAFGHLYNTAVADLAGAKLIRKLYTAPLTDEGARKAAHEYAADILAQFGVPSLAGTKIYFISDRTGNKEVWAMDFDGSNQRQITNFRSITTTPAISPDGLRLAFTSYAKGQPQIMLWSTETNRMIPFLNPQASLNATPNFAPDGSKIYFASSLNSDTQIYAADVSGANLKRISTSRAIEVEPKVNPKTGSDIVFVSGRSGPQQIYRMNLDGAGVERLTTGEGEAANPSWHPDGQHIVFKWTRGFAPGNWNIFVMDVASRETVQLTFGAGRNENPVWAPDGRHIAFASNRNGRFQIYTMLADGTGLKQLTNSGNNTMPVWSK
jgi:TolB protein